MRNMTHTHLELATIIALLILSLAIVFKGIDGEILKLVIYAMAAASGITLFRNPPSNNGKPSG